MRKLLTIKPFKLNISIPLLVVQFFWERYGVSVTFTSPDHLHSWLLWLGIPAQETGFADIFGLRQKRFWCFARII